jgi:hypothetical protein
MTKLRWHLDEAVMRYDTLTEVESQTAPGVKFTIARMSFGRRVDLMRKVRELSKRIEFLEAGREPGDRMDAALMQAEIDRVYLLWGLQSVTGLEIDGSQATPELLAASGPEGVFREAVQAVRRETGLTEDERKNS